MPGQLSHRNHPTHGGTAVDGWHELSVANSTFLLERLGSECTDLQGLRELTVRAPAIRTVIEAHVREWCEQILVEVVLAARSSSWTPDQLDALLSPGSLTAALLPRHLLHATLQKRLAQKLGATRNPINATTVRSCAIDERRDRNDHEEHQ